MRQSVPSHFNWTLQPFTIFCYSDDLSSLSVEGTNLHLSTVKSDVITDITTEPRSLQKYIYIYGCRPVIFYINRYFEMNIKSPHALPRMPLHYILLFQNVEWNISGFNFGFSINNTHCSTKLQVKPIELAVLYLIFSFAAMKLLCLPNG
jgi:hypothetical protein